MPAEHSNPSLATFPDNSVAWGWLQQDTDITDSGYLHFTKGVKLSSAFTGGKLQCKVSETKGFTQMKNPINLPKHGYNKYHLHYIFKRIKIILQEKL